MGPKTKSNISDQRSADEKARRGRPAVSPALMLAAAERLFANTGFPSAVTMDDIAASARVGKGTLFRAFGNREGLLNALWIAKLASLRNDVEDGHLALGPRAPSRERAVAFLDALLLFKLKNMHLIRALELGAGVLQSEHYKWMHSLLRNLIEDAAPAAKAGDAVFEAHVLLAGLHIDLVEVMIAEGLTIEVIRQAQARHVRAVIDSTRSNL